MSKIISLRQKSVDLFSKVSQRIDHLNYFFFTFTRHIMCICTKYWYWIGIADTSLNFTQYRIAKEVGGIKHH